MPRVKVTEIIEGLYHLEFPNLYLMNATLIRFQEYYESPKFKGKAFDLEDFMDWYADREGKFDYFETIEGMNFPIQMMDDMGKTVDCPFERKEGLVWDYFENDSIYEDGYIIATAKTSMMGAKAHEIAHGMYYLIPAYRREITKAMNRTLIYKSAVKTLQKALSPNCYHRSMYKDECHAHLIDGIRAVDMDAFTGIGREVFKELSRGLRKIYRRYLEENKIDKKRRDLVL